MSYGGLGFCSRLGRAEISGICDRYMAAGAAGNYDGGRSYWTVAEAGADSRLHCSVAAEEAVLESGVEAAPPVWGRG
jgi:hypothetical protein